ncbi:MAG: alpha/beta fold hydrolase [Solirubrobacterales bacterium]|nr:alpha/beta fold hydrolase [Solirubrobacterales bacterium]
MSAEFTPSHRGGSGSPLVCLHGFTDTWRTWELVLPALEAEHDVLAPTLLAHAGGPPLEGEVSDQLIIDAVERSMDDAGFEQAHIVGNSLGGYVALELAARGRAESVVAFAPAGGWAEEDNDFEATLDNFVAMYEQLLPVAAQADAIVSTPEGRRLVTQLITINYEHIPAELLAHQIIGVTRCQVMPLIEYARHDGFELDAGKIECPVRVVWGTADQILAWPANAARFQGSLTGAEWVELDGIGHCPQLDVPTEAAQLILGFTA